MIEGTMTKPFLLLLFSSMSLFFFSWSALADLGCSSWIGSSERRSAILTVVENSMRSAGEAILQIRSSKDMKIQEKKNFADLKTAGDLTSQRIILTALSQNPLTRNAKFLAEEKSEETNHLTQQELFPSDSLWVLDPIDGTTNFAHGLPHFSISLAFVIEGKPCFGAVYAPVYDEFYFAWDGQGAYLKTQKGTQVEKLHVSQVSDLSKSLWVTGTEGGPGSKAFEKNKNTFDLALKLLPQTQDLRRTGSAALDLAFVAAGRVEGYVEFSEGLKWWDVIAGLLLVSEAGGFTSVKEPASNALLGSRRLTQPIQYVLATNGNEALHHQFKSALFSIFK
jgi:myo-inositol-1(or 4)-monophosphatase